MKFNKIYFVLIFFLFFSCKENENVPREPSSILVVDDLGIEHTFSGSPKTAVSLAPNLTEFIFALGVQEKLIGNTLYCNFPKEAKNIEKVGDLLSVNYEKISALDPDIIFITVEGNSKGSYQKLIELGFNVFVSNPRNYAGIKKTLADMSKIFDRAELADKIILEWDKRLTDLVTVNSTLENTSAIFMISVNPLILAGKPTFINSILNSAGLKNAAAISELNYPVFSREKIFKMNPQILITSEKKDNFIDNVTSIYPEWRDLSAIKNGSIIYVDADIFFRPGPRFVDAVEDLSAKIRALLDPYPLHLQ